MSDIIDGFASLPEAFLWGWGGFFLGWACHLLLVSLGRHAEKRLQQLNTEAGTAPRSQPYFDARIGACVFPPWEQDAKVYDGAFLLKDGQIGVVTRNGIEILPAEHWYDFMPPKYEFPVVSNIGSWYIMHSIVPSENRREEFHAPILGTNSFRVFTLPDAAAEMGLTEAELRAHLEAVKARQENDTP